MYGFLRSTGPRAVETHCWKVAVHVDHAQDVQNAALVPWPHKRAMFFAVWVKRKKQNANENRD